MALTGTMHRGIAKTNICAGAGPNVADGLKTVLGHLQRSGGAVPDQERIMSMAGKVNRHAYQTMIDQDVWPGESMPRTLERDHAIMIVRTRSGLL